MLHIIALHYIKYFLFQVIDIVIDRRNGG
jgi:hypothetical protein